MLNDYVAANMSKEKQNQISERERENERERERKKNTDKRALWFSL